MKALHKVRVADAIDALDTSPLDLETAYLGLFVDEDDVGTPDISGVTDVGNAFETIASGVGWMDGTYRHMRFCAERNERARRVWERSLAKHRYPLAEAKLNQRRQK